ncbi:MAG: hypothetical protein AAFY03_07200, partial [Pseudomonadota bacterium]
GAEPEVLADAEHAADTEEPDATEDVEPAETVVVVAVANDAGEPEGVAMPSRRRMKFQFEGAA